MGALTPRVGNCACIIKHPFRHCGFASVDMRNDSNVSDLGELVVGLGGKVNLFLLEPELSFSLDSFLNARNLAQTLLQSSLGHKPVTVPQKHGEIIGIGSTYSANKKSVSAKLKSPKVEL